MATQLQVAHNTRTLLLMKAPANAGIRIKSSVMIFVCMKSVSAGSEWEWNTSEWTSLQGLGNQQPCLGWHQSLPCTNTESEVVTPMLQWWKRWSWQWKGQHHLLKCEKKTEMWCHQGKSQQQSVKQPYKSDAWWHRSDFQPGLTSNFRRNDSSC